VLLAMVEIGNYEKFLYHYYCFSYTELPMK